jgi:hypothetical protein
MHHRAGFLAGSSRVELLPIEHVEAFLCIGWENATRDCDRGRPSIFDGFRFEGRRVLLALGNWRPVGYRCGISYPGPRLIQGMP